MLLGTCLSGNKDYASASIAYPQPAMVINLLWGLSALSKLRSKPCLKLEKTVYLDEPRQRWMTYYVIPTAFLQAV